jgi:hypothetical protein
MITLEREMSASRKEFLHGLKLAFPHGVEEAGALLKVGDGETAMEIELAALPDLAIALLRLPRIRVSIRFTAGSREQQAAMLARMDRAMQRGGG